MEHKVIPKAEIGAEAIYIKDKTPEEIRQIAKENNEKARKESEEK